VPSWGVIDPRDGRDFIPRLDRSLSVVYSSVMRTPPTSLVLPPDLRARLEAHSERTGAPMAVLTRRALVRYLDWLDKQMADGEKPPNGDGRTP